MEAHSDFQCSGLQVSHDSLEPKPASTTRWMAGAISRLRAEEAGFLISTGAR